MAGDMMSNKKTIEPRGTRGELKPLELNPPLPAEDMGTHSAVKAKRQRCSGLSSPCSPWLKFLPFAFCLLPFSSATAAEALRDPTRPPAVLYAPADGAGIETGPVLQSVLISQGRRTAVISGRSVKVGDRFDDGRVIRINETEVVLKTGSGLQTLKLFPDVEKRTAVQTKRRKR